MTLQGRVCIIEALDCVNYYQKLFFISGMHYNDGHNQNYNYKQLK